jgi:hypothetical protein
VSHAHLVSACACCGDDSKVYDSRPSPKGFITRQRRCVSCGLRWTTYEVGDSYEFRRAIEILSSFFPKPVHRRKGAQLSHKIKIDEVLG